MVHGRADGDAIVFTHRSQLSGKTEERTDATHMPRHAPNAR